jgi:zinc/manganese transport system substrate-binding protein
LTAPSLCKLRACVHLMLPQMAYNHQVTDSVTETFLQAAHRYGIPVVGVYETMPTPGYNYQSWMLAEVNALRKAVAGKVSTERL